MLVALLLAAVVLLILLLSRAVDRGALLMLAATLCIGLAAYAATGSPGLAAAPGKSAAAQDEEAVGRLLALRADMDQHFGPSRTTLIFADGLSRRGDHQLASAWIRGALRTRPKDADLWNALGVDLMLAARGRLTAPAQLAFARARAARPLHPGPDYFTGLAALMEGNLPEALGRWDALLARPGGTDSDWRREITRQRALLANAQRPGPAPDQPIGAAPRPAL